MSRSEGAWLNLDRGGDAHFGEPGHVLLGQELRVLDPLAQAQRRPLVAGLLEGVERLPVGEIADRMDRHGPAGAAPRSARSQRAPRDP